MIRWVLLGLTMLIAGRLSAQGDRWERAVAAGLNRTDSLMRTRGSHPSGTRSFGSLRPGESRWVPLGAPGAGRMTVVGLCDGDCAGLGLVVRNVRGYELVADRSGSTVPLVEFDAEAGRRYEVRVVMGDCRMAPCRYGIASYASGTRAVRPSP